VELIKRGDVASPELRREVVPVAALGGAVAVVEMTLGDRLDFEALLQAQKGADKAATADVTVPHLLAACVRDADGLAVFTADEWKVWGARNHGAAIGLFNIAFRLCGFDGDAAAKNS
jgi:hypothetical protein